MSFVYRDGCCADWTCKTTYLFLTEVNMSAICNWTNVSVKCKLQRKRLFETRQDAHMPTFMFNITAYLQYFHLYGTILSYMFASYFPKIVIFLHFHFTLNLYITVTIGGPFLFFFKLFIAGRGAKAPKSLF